MFLSGTVSNNLNKIRAIVIGTHSTHHSSSLLSWIGMSQPLMVSIEVIRQDFIYEPRPNLRSAGLKTAQDNVLHSL
jgi:hypothetical protein